MEKIIDGHLVGFGALQEWEEYEDYIWRGSAGRGLEIRIKL